MHRLALRSAIAASLLAHLSFAAPSAVSLGVSETPQAVDLAGVSDTWVDGGDPQASHGPDTDLIARFEEGKPSRVLLGFDFGPIEGAHVEAAQLKLDLRKARGASTIQMAASGILAAWSESTTWADQPDRSPTYSVQEVESAPGVISWDVTQLLRDTIEAKGSLQGIALSGPVAGPTHYARLFASRETGQPGPKLSVQYVAGAAVRASPTPAGTPSPADTSAAEEAAPGARAVRIGLAALAAVALVTAAIVLVRRRATSKNSDSGGL